MGRIAGRHRWFLVLLLAAAGPGAAASAEEAPGDENFDWSRYVRLPSPGAESRLQVDSLRAAIRNGSLDEAEIVAKQAVERASTEGSSAAGRAQALQNLAAVQYLRKDLAPAIRNYRAAVDAIVAREDHLSADLVLPLQALAIAYDADERPVEAFDTLTRALHVSNVNFGPHSLQQVPIIESIMDMHYAHGDDESGNDALDRITMIYTRRFGREADELLPVLRRRAAEFRRQHSLFEERREWRHMLDVIRHTRGEDDLAMIEPLTGLAENFMAEMTHMVFRARPTGPTAEYYFLQAQAIADGNPDSDAMTRVKCMLALGDYYTRIDMPARARNWYGQAWALMSGNDALLAERADLMERPNALYAPAPARYANFGYDLDARDVRDSDYAKGHIVVTYSVDDRGRARDIEIIEAEPPDFGRMETHVTATLKNYVYRPRYRGGSPRAVKNLRFRHDFLYLPEVYRESSMVYGKVRRARQAAEQAARRERD
jgi:hypothetical protein